MLVKQSLSDQHIIDCLNINYGTKVATLNFLPLGADMNAWVYKAEAHDHSAYFVKLKRGHHHDISITILQLLHHAGIQQIILPVKTILGHTTQRINDFTLIVYPFIEGQNGFSRDLTDEQWLILGKAFRKVHDIDVPSPIQKLLRRETFSSKWHEVVRSLYKLIEAEHAGDEVAQKLLVFMKENILAIQRLVNRSEQVSRNTSERNAQIRTLPF
jgi:spectinomycin phosphotransferase